PHGDDALGNPARRRMRAARGGMAQFVEPARFSALPAPLPNVERLTADAMPPAQLANGENTRLVLTNPRDTLFHATGLLERHRPISSNRATTLTCQDSTRSKLSGLSPVCTSSITSPTSLKVRKCLSITDVGADIGKMLCRNTGCCVRS